MCVTQCRLLQRDYVTSSERKMSPHPRSSLRWTHYSTRVEKWSGKSQPGDTHTLFWSPCDINKRRLWKGVSWVTHPIWSLYLNVSVKLNDFQNSFIIGNIYILYKATYKRAAKAIRQRDNNNHNGRILCIRKYWHHWYGPPDSHIYLFSNLHFCGHGCYLFDMQRA